MTHDPRHDAHMRQIMSDRTQALQARGLPVTGGLLCEAMALQLDAPEVERLVVIEAMRGQYLAIAAGARVVPLAA